MNEIVVELIGFLATLTNIVGNLLIVRVNVWAWPLRLVSNVAWVIYAYSTALVSFAVILNAVCFFGINIWGWRSWARRRKLEERFE